MARLLLQTVEGPRTIELGAVNSLGRHPNNSIQVLDRIASKEHCLIELKDGQFVLRDRGSMNGTYVNGARAHGPVVLADGDEISLGSTRAIFHAGAVGEQGSGADPRAADLPSERILVHLATNKAVYRPGEVLYARAVVLDAETGAPALPSNLAFEIRDAQGVVLVSRLSHAAEGVAPFSWALPADLEDGEHQIFARCPTETFPPAELGFSVHAARPPRFSADLELSRRAYGPGDEVVAALWAARAEGGELAGAAVSALGTIDGEVIAESALTLDADGRCSLRFRLPEELDGSEGAVTMTLREGEIEETVTRPLTLARTRVLLALHPEGGDLVLGLPARLYVEARTPRGAPVEVAGRIVDAGGAVLAHFHTEHEGRGRVMILPARAGGAYHAVLDEPVGLGERYPLPDVTREGLSLIALDDRSEAGEALHFRLASTSAARVRLAVHRRDQEVFALPLDLAAGEVKDLTVKPPAGATGVLRVTLHDALGRPRAERLIFRRPASALRVEIEALPLRPGPGATMSLRVRTTARGRPVAATVMVSVVDEAGFGDAPLRARPPRLPEQALLGTEVSELGDPAAYLGEGNAAARRLDLLLGTQGWRRFAFYDVARFADEQGDRAERVLARRKPPVVAVTQAVALLPELAPLAAVGSPCSPSPALFPPDSSLPEATPEPGAVRQRVAPGQHIPGKGTGAEGLPPLPGPPLAMGVSSAQKAAASGARARPVTSGAPPPPVGRMVTVREHAHRTGSAPGIKPGQRVDTLYWSSGITTSVNGEVTVEFDLPDAVTTFRVRADAFSALGALGSGDATIAVCAPISIEAKLPAEVCAGDVIDVPFTLINATPGRVDGRLSLVVQGPLIAGREAIPFSIAPESRERILVPAAVISGRGSASLVARATAGRHAAVESRCLGIVPAGFPADLDVAGRLAPDGLVAHRLLIPEAIEPGSLTTELRLYPSAASALSSAFEALLVEPSSGLEPLLYSADLAAALLQQLAAAGGGDPRLFRRANDRLDEVAHALCRDAAQLDVPAALGLRLLARLPTVFPVSPEQIERVAQALLSRRDAGGGDSSLLGLVANLVLGAGEGDASELLARLAEHQEADGAVRGAWPPASAARTVSLEIETTALAALAWARAGDRARGVRAIDWIHGRCQGGRFGATRATWLSVQAIVAWAQAFPPERRSGALVVSIDGEPVATRTFGADEADPIVLRSFRDALRPGEHTVELRTTGGWPLPYSLRVRTHSRSSPPASAGDLRLGLELAADEVIEGEPVTLAVELENTGAEPRSGVTAILGLPAGLEAIADALEALRAAGAIERWELRGRDLVLGMPSMAARALRRLTIPLCGAIPGTYRGSASRLLALDADDAPAWAAPLAIHVLAAR